MKLNFDNKYFHWGLTAFLVIIASISFFLALFRLDEFSNALNVLIKIISPILYGLVLGYLMIPVMSFFEKHILKLLLRIKEKNKAKIKHINKKDKHIKLGKLSRGLAIVCTLIVNLSVIITLFSMVIPQLFTSVMGLIDNIDLYSIKIQELGISILADNPNLEVVFLKIYGNFSEYLTDWITTDILPQINDLLSGVTSGVFDVLVTIKDLLIGIIVSVYVMASKDIFSAQAKKILFAWTKPETANSIIETSRKTHKIFGGFISGKLLDSLIICIICLICLNLMQIPYSLLISVIIGVTNIIPFFGPFIGAIPSAILILLVDPIKAIYFAIFILVLQQFDGNILGPKILGDSTGLSSFWVMFAILLAGGLFGFIGMIIGVPVFAVIYSLISESVAKSLKNKNLPTQTDDYKNLKFVDEKTNDLIHQKYTMLNNKTKK